MIQLQKLPRSFSQFSTSPIAINLLGIQIKKGDNIGINMLCRDPKKKQQMKNIRIWSHLYTLTSFFFTLVSIAMTALSNLYIHYSRTSASNKLRIAIVQSFIMNDSSYSRFYRVLDAYENNTICGLFNLKTLDRLYKIPASKLTIPCFIALSILTIILSRRKSCGWFCGGYVSMPTVYNPFSKVNRFESASVFGILAVEVVHIFDEFVFNTTNYVSYGPLLDLFKQTGLVVMIGARYFPILAALELDPPSFVCFGLSAAYVWLEIYCKMALDAYCPPRVSLHISQAKLDLIAQSYMNKQSNNMSKNGSYHSTNQMDIMNLWNLLWLSHDSIRLNIFKQLPYYFFSCFLAVRLTLKFVLAACAKIIRLKNRRTQGNREYSKMLNSTTMQQHLASHSNEMNYVQQLFQTRSHQRTEWTALSGVISLAKFVYPWNSYFSFSKQVVNVYIIAFTLIYYFTFWTIENSERIVDHAFRLIHLGLLYTFSQNPSNGDLTSIADLKNKAQYRIVEDLRIISSMTAIFCCFQLFFGLRRFQKQMLSAYKGKFDSIPPRRRFKNTTILSKAMHYPGYMIGYLIWGYLFMLVISFTIFVLLKNVVKLTDLIEALARWIIPMLVLLLLKLVLIKILSKTIFTQDSGRSLALNNTKFLYVFNYFNFFFDCFLGLLMCISRVSQASIAAILLLSRLDQSMFGRGLELYDKGFTAYACWVHLESVQTHPVLIVFCEVVRSKIILRRAHTSRLLVEFDYKGSAASLQVYKQTIGLEMVKYTRKQRASFKYSLFLLLAKNPWLTQFRKHRQKVNKRKSRYTLEDTWTRIKSATALSIS
ncbi:hypothetical protein ACOME3_008589 [Neoechinorhynchus agilis]